MTHQNSFAGKLAHNIGLIVLESQELERHLKLVAAATDPSPSSSIIDRHKKMERRPLGEVVKQFMGNITVTEGSIEDLDGYFRWLLDRRNRVVHHFHETYYADYAAGRHGEILTDLALLHADLRAAAKMFKSINMAFLESLDQEQSLPE